MTENKSNKEQIEWEKSGGVPSGEGEYRNQEQGISESVSKEKIEQLIKEQNNNN